MTKSKLNELLDTNHPHRCLHHTHHQICPRLCLSDRCFWLRGSCHRRHQSRPHRCSSGPRWAPTRSYPGWIFFFFYFSLKLYIMQENAAVSVHFAQTCVLRIPSPSASSSQASPIPSLSASSWPELGTVRQLSWTTGAETDFKSDHARDWYALLTDNVLWNKLIVHKRDYVTVIFSYKI